MKIKKKENCMSELKKPSALGIISGSLAIVILLTIDNSKSEILKAIKFFSIVILTYGVIQVWIRYIKEYIDFAIEQKSKKVDNEIKNQ